MSLFLAVFVAAQQTGKALLEQGRTKKTAGDLQGAMEAFEKVIADSAATDRNATANALLEMGGIADSLGQLNRARNFYERVRTEFKDQAAEAAVASDRLKNQPTSPTSSAVGATAGATPSRSNEGPAKVTIRTPYTEDVYSFTISPDGRTLVFQGTSLEGKRQLWRQAVDPSSKAEPITGTEGAGASAFPFFSPDGKSVVFFAKQKFWQVDLAGGVAKEVTDAAS
jgi:tetratricopeptide (TPR) repeat protein